MFCFYSFPLKFSWEFFQAFKASCSLSLCRFSISLSLEIAFPFCLLPVRTSLRPPTIPLLLPIPTAFLKFLNPPPFPVLIFPSFLPLLLSPSSPFHPFSLAAAPLSSLLPSLSPSLPLLSVSLPASLFFSPSLELPFP